MPQGSADAFRLLNKAKIMSDGCARAMIGMVGFRNIAVHEYQAMDMGVLRAIGESRWRDVVAYCRELGLTICP